MSAGGTLWQCPAVGPPGQKVLLKKVAVLPPLALGFCRISKTDSSAPDNSGSQRYFFSKFQLGLI